MSQQHLLTYCLDITPDNNTTWNATGRIIGADIVEYNPENDVNKITAAVASKLVKEIGAKMLLSNGIVHLPEGVQL